MWHSQDHRLVGQLKHQDARSANKTEDVEGIRGGEEDMFEGVCT